MSGNTISDDLEVFRNAGPVEKTITDNTGGDELECYGNEEPILATGNTGWNKRKGQCRVVYTCEAGIPGIDADEVIVPANAACILADATITGDVTVGEGAYFQPLNTDIGGKVRATNAQTLFIDSESTVGRDVKSDGTAQVYIYNSTVGHGIDIDNTTEVVQICGNTVTRDDLKVTDSGLDILVGSSDPVVDCGGNTVSHGDLKLERNLTDVEFVVSGNTVSDDLEVNRNAGPVEKTITDNTGGDELECFGNEEPILATGNTFPREQGQCVEAPRSDGERSPALTGSGNEKACTPVRAFSCPLAAAAASARRQAPPNIRDRRPLEVFALNSGAPGSGSGSAAASAASIVSVTRRSAIRPTSGASTKRKPPEVLITIPSKMCSRGFSSTRSTLPSTTASEECTSVPRSSSL